jgi:hypothetical protein
MRGRVVWPRAKFAASGNAASIEGLLTGSFHSRDFPNWIPALRGPREAGFLCLFTDGTWRRGIALAWAPDEPEKLQKPFRAEKRDLTAMPKENDLEGVQDQGGKHGGQKGLPKPEPCPPGARIKASFVSSGDRSNRVTKRARPASEPAGQGWRPAGAKRVASQRELQFMRWKMLPQVEPFRDPES